MVSIPKSPGVRARPTTQVGGVAPVQTQIIPQAVSRLGATIADIGISKAQRDKEAFEATQFLDYKTKLKTFDNQQRIKLAELPPNEETISNAKKQILSDRQSFINDLQTGFKGNTRLTNLSTQEAKASGVNVEFNLDKEIADKKRTFGVSKIFDSISSLRERSLTAKTPEEFIDINNDLTEVLQTGLTGNLITVKDIERQQKAFRDLRKERAKELQNQQTFSDVLAGSVLIDSTHKDDRNLINSNFEKLIPEAEDPEELAEQLSIKTGVVPNRAKQAWSSRLLNGTPTQKVESAETINDLILENPNLEREFNSQEKALSKAISNRISLGLPLDQVVSFAEEEIKQNKTQERVVREGRFNLEFGKSETSKKAIEQIQDINSEFEDESGFFFEAKVPDQIGLEVRRLAKDFFLNEGVDMDTALDLAKDKVKGEWFITNIGQKRYQKFAPERFYARPGISNKWIENQAIDTVKKITPDDVTAKQLRKQMSLEVIPDTLLTGLPSYNVFTENEFGAIEMVLDNQNLPVVFTPDFTKTEEYKKDLERRNKLRLTPEKKEEFTSFRKQRKLQRQKEKNLARVSSTLTGIR